MTTTKTAHKPKKKASAKPRKPRRQCAAIPIRHDPDGQLRVLLVTSRETHRWVVPKGWTAEKLTLPQAAAREAFEEAGVVGRINGKAPLGSYCYEMRLASGRIVQCKVAVFLLHIEQQLESWPEKDQRELKWATPAEASELVEEPELAALLLGLAA